jgi:multidrug efflux pump subunit AcrA (membrane-fusion protein)
VGDKAIITFDAYPDRKFEAKVSEIEAIANPYTGTFEVEVQLQQSDVHLFSGFVGKITIIPSIAREYSVIPIESLIEGDLNEGYIFSADRQNDIATKHKIKIDKIIGNQMLVYSGLEGIKEVVTYGAPYLTENTLIEIVE